MAYRDIDFVWFVFSESGDDSLPSARVKIGDIMGSISRRSLEMVGGTRPVAKCNADPAREVRGT